MQRRESMIDTGGLYQLAELLTMAAGVLIVVILVAFLVSRLFRSAKTRKRIMIGAAVLYLIAFVGYFGFIATVLSGNLN